MSSAPSIALSLRDALGVPASKVPINGTTFVLYVLPPVLYNVVMALLAVTPQTRTIRVALWPLIALFALRAVLSVDVSIGKMERKFLNIDLVLCMLAITVRTFDWALAKEPLVRRLRPRKSSPSTIMDALDLATNFRGHGWEWSRGLYVPRETRPTKSRTAFALHTFVSAIVHALLCGTLHRAILVLAPVGTGSIPEGSTIFDDTLAFPVRYLRASIISVMIAFTIYAGMQTSYYLSTIPAVLFLGQDPAQWPPIFDAPWRATSVSDFWSHRWHQMFRQVFLLLGGYPLSLVLGRPGLVIGSFLASVWVHHITMTTLNNQSEIWWMLLGFGMMAPGVLAERVFLQLTGKRVGGIVGWIWAMTWIVLWGTVMAEGFARAGMLGCAGFVDSALPVRIPIEPLAASFDAWLHNT